MILSAGNENEAGTMRVAPSSTGEVYFAIAVVSAVLVIEMAAFVILGN